MTKGRFVLSISKTWCFPNKKIISEIKIIARLFIAFLSQKIVFVLANSADPDEMLHYAAFHLGLTVCQSTVSRLHRVKASDHKKKRK